MATDWAENRANIPDDWFRRTIGKVIDFAYSSGTRDRFRTLVNARRTATRYLDHAQRDGRNDGRPAGRHVVALEERPRNPVLEAVFLSKLMQKFGLTDAQAKQLLTDARPRDGAGAGRHEQRRRDAATGRVVRSRMAARGARPHQLRGRQS